MSESVCLSSQYSSHLPFISLSISNWFSPINTTLLSPLYSSPILTYCPSPSLLPYTYYILYIHIYISRPTLLQSPYTSSSLFAFRSSYHPLFFYISHFICFHSLSPYHPLSLYSSLFICVSLYLYSSISLSFHLPHHLHFTHTISYTISHTIYSLSASLHTHTHEHFISA